MRDNGTSGGGGSSWMEDMNWKIQKRIACKLGVRMKKKKGIKDYKGEKRHPLWEVLPKLFFGSSACLLSIFLHFPLFIFVWRELTISLFRKLGQLFDPVALKSLPPPSPALFFVISWRVAALPFKLCLRLLDRWLLVVLANARTVGWLQLTRKRKTRSFLPLSLHGSMCATTTTITNGCVSFMAPASQELTPAPRLS